jgi:hypothetical protein
VAWGVKLATQLQECVEIYLHSPNTPSWRVLLVRMGEVGNAYDYLVGNPEGKSSVGEEGG